MSEVGPKYDDEIDLFEFFSTLWDGKYLVSAFMTLAALMGFGYSQFAQAKYDVSVPFVINGYSVSAQQICGDNIKCLESVESNRMLSFLDSSWSKKKRSSTISFSTSSPSDTSEYEVQITQANMAFTNAVYVEATTELVLIQTELSDALLSTERVATNMLNAKRIVQSVNNGQSPITFGSVSVVKSSPKLPLLLSLSIVLGGMTGVMFIFARSAIKKRKERFAKA